MLGAQFVRVMPMVEFGGDHDLLQRAPLPPHVGMQKEAEQNLQQGEQANKLQGKAGHSHKHERRGEECAVEGMVAEAADPVEPVRRMVNGMEAPKERHLMAEAMQPVREQIKEEHAEYEANGAGQRQYERAQ